MTTRKLFVKIEVDFTAFNRAMRRFGISVRMLDRSYRIRHHRRNPALDPVADREILEALYANRDALVDL